MIIDIISYNEQQYANMTNDQLSEVQSAQRKKDRLTAALEENLEKKKMQLVENGTYLSGMWTSIQEKLTKEYEREVEVLREQLLFYLQFSTGTEEEKTAPYTLDYSLTSEERLYAVKDYYMSAYSNGKERFEAYKADTVAPNYLGELYASLYDYFLALA